MEINICSDCNGTGEGRHESQLCRSCGGSGEIESEALKAAREEMAADAAIDDYEGRMRLKIGMRRVIF
jgi:DnaJ-class molecular chaperone